MKNKANARKMTHDNKLELKPKLRFPDFQDDGPWESKPLDDICDRIVDKIGDAKLTTVSITAGRGFVSQTEKFGRNIAGAQYKNYILLQRGDFAYNKGNSNVYPQGCVYRLKEFDQAAASNAFICFRLKQGFAPGFIEGLFQKNTHGRQLVRFLTSGARSDGLLNIKPAEFFSVRLPIPRRLAEQHKIADCLSSLDELIAAHGRKLDALKTQKKGLMQRLFPREGETFPRLRFPEFRDKSAWEIVAFGEMGFDVSDGNYSSKYPSQSDFVQVGVPFLRANNLRRGSISDEDMKFISEKQHSEITKGHLKRGDILLSNRGQIGSVALVPDRHIGSNINAQLVRINTGSKSDNVFIFQLLDSFSRNGVFESMSTGTALKQLPIGKLNGLELILPTELKEQRLIASCLSALDDLIAAQTQKLDALKTHKNGLMQQLFPVTGRGRSMSPIPFADLTALAQHLRQELNNKKFILLYAYNGTGKTRLSTTFKDLGKNGDERDTLYFNAFTEDLFSWDNDLANDRERVLKINKDSRFFAGLEEMEFDNRIRPLLDRYADFDFKIDTDNWEVSFSREVQNGDGVETVDDIKVSRGEENIFIWCFFLAVVQLALDGAEAYAWVKHIYIDDPITSLDEQNAIAVATHLARLVKKPESELKTVISTHHTLFFNVLCNELQNRKRDNLYFLSRDRSSAGYSLRRTGNTPFFHHVAALIELYEAERSGEIYTHHFNMLRAILEKTASFHGYENFSACIRRDENDVDGVLHTRLVNLLSHGNYSLYEPREMLEENKRHFRTILHDFIQRYPFNPALFPSEPAGEPTT